jgi:hypothetical protein
MLQLGTFFELEYGDIRSTASTRLLLPADRSLSFELFSVDNQEEFKVRSKRSFVIGGPSLQFRSNSCCSPACCLRATIQHTK